ncbi:MAG: HAMP domain-containing sensor histidine kinase [Planctomycetota bacterium]
MRVPAPQLPPTAPRLTALFLASALALVLVTAALTIHLTGQAVENRVEAELVQTARLIGGAGFPLNDVALEQVADYIGADVVATDAAGKPVASSLAPDALDDFRATELPAPPRAAKILACEIGDASYTLGVAPTGLGVRTGAVYILYPEDTIAAQARAAWLPVVGVAVLGVLLAVVLGVYSERRVRAHQTSRLVRLLASVAHEVRNPLGAIRTLARTTQRRVTSEPERRSLDLIAGEADRLALLADGLRCVGLPVRTLKSEVEPERAVADVLTLLAPQLEHRRVQVAHLPAPDVTIAADPAQVRQVVMNLVLNAADAMPRGGLVRCIGRRVGDRWELAVEDEGPGVAPEARATLFAPFESTKQKGLGVGLYLSRRLAEANGATLELDPHYTAGARFVARWPASATAPRVQPDDAGRAPLETSSDA